jgi:hypothetical protein
MKIGCPGTESTVAHHHRRSARHRRPWDANTNAKLGLQGLPGQPVAERCIEDHRSQSLRAQGCQPLAIAFMEAHRTLGLQRACT